MGGGAKDAGRRRSEKQALGAAQGLCRKSKTRENDAPKSADQSAAYAGRAKKKGASTPSEKERSHLMMWGLLTLMLPKQHRSWTPQLFPERVARK